jgi:hypothetical protein
MNWKGDFMNNQFKEALIGLAALAVFVLLLILSR